MGFKLVCTECRLSFSAGNETEVKHSKKCRSCGRPAHLLHHKFKPPKRTDKEKWQIVAFLISHGFDFSSAYIPLADQKAKYLGHLQIDYPQTMEEAKLFVETVVPKGKI